MSFISVANASEAAGTLANTGSSLMSLLPMVLIFVIFYFFLIRPQVKKQRAVESMISELKKGDEVVAGGGLYGVISKIEDNIVHLEIADNVKIKVLKTSITECLSKDHSSTGGKDASIKKIDSKDKKEAKKETKVSKSKKVSK